MLPADEGQPRLPALPGMHRLASRCSGDGTGGPELSVELGKLRVFPANAEPNPEAGQWVYWLDEALPPSAASVVIEAAARLGIVPVHFSAKFEQRLAEPGPICLVADTNTLYHGSLFQALSFRNHRATHVALADQVLMELQKQRETAYRPGAGAAKVTATSEKSQQPSDHIARWCKAARRSTFLSAGARSLRRIRKAGHILHVARPPEAMVRYFGGGRHGGEDDESNEDSTIVGSNALRDRLILQAAIQQRVALPDVPVWLLTDDALLAEQASLEGLNVGFAWLPSISSGMLTSPFFSPRSLQLQHVAAHEFVDELLWSTGNLLVQREEENRASFARVFPDRRDRALTELGEPGYLVRWDSERSTPWSLTATVPQKAPTPVALLAALLSTLRRPLEGKKTEAERGIVKYLAALGWVGADGLATTRGRKLAEGWLALDYANADAWAIWLDEAAQDIERLQPIAATLAALAKRGSASDGDLAADLQSSARTVAAQLVLTSAFGLSVRLGSKGRRSGAWTAQSAQQAVLSAIRAQLSGVLPGVTAADVGKLFTALQRPEATPMPFHVFRRALVHLEEAGKVVFSGSVPHGRDAVSVHLLRPTKSDARVTFKLVTVGSGGTIVEGRPTKVVQLPGGAR